MATTRELFREYGALAVVIVACMAGYIYYSLNTENVLDYSLDVIGNQLVSLVEDESARAAIADRFDQFKQRVVEERVSPDQVEYLAANVLNLSQSGAKLTAEEAELVLEFATMDFPEPEHPEPPGETPEPAAAMEPGEEAEPFDEGAFPEPEHLEKLGERLEAAIEFHHAMHEAAREHAVEEGDVVRFVRFQFDEGLRVDVDPELADEMKRKELDRLARRLHELERRKMVVWRKPSDPDFRRSQEALRWIEQRGGPQTLVVLSRLREKGFHPGFDPDSLEQVMEAHVEQAVKAHEEAIEKHVKELEQAQQERARAGSARVNQ